MEPKYPKGLLWKMKQVELEKIAEDEGIYFPEDISRLDLYRLIVANMPMVGTLVISPAPAVLKEEPDDSPASARIKRIRQASQ